MFIDFLKDIFHANQPKDFIIWRNEAYNYRWLLDRIRYWKERIESEGIQAGEVVVLEADFSPNSIALLLSLIEHACILVPLTSSVKAMKSEFINIAQGEISINIDNNDYVHIENLSNDVSHGYYRELRQANHPGLVLFSSGSTGKSKAAVHDFLGILEKFKLPRHSLRTITFLLYDHIGGVNTMLYVLSNAGCIVTVSNRSPDNVLAAVEAYKVELLPTSPTFINLILLSEAYKRHDLGSLKMMTYGTEPMPESTLRRFHALFPHIRLLQTYGLSEVGILRSKSKSSNSLWVKVGGEDFETRIVDDVLQIKAQSAMLGYLNAPSPFTEDGWFDTSDMVEVDGEYIRILGRQSDIINVGGEKVYPAEVESIIQEIENVAEATVYSEKNAITGNIVCAKIRLIRKENKKSFISRLKHECRKKMANYKVPVRISIIEEKQYSNRFKKMRNI